MDRPTLAAPLRREGPPASPRRSASLILVRDGRDGLELLLVRRNPAAVGAYRAGELALVFPTLKLLEGLAAFATVDDLLAHACDLVVEPILPRVVMCGAEARVLLPGEPGYHG